MTAGGAGPHHRLDALRRDLLARLGNDPVVAETLQEMSAALEELAVQTEQLREQGEALQELAVALDIERRQNRELFDDAPEPYVVTEGAGVVRERNDAAEAIGVVENRPLVLRVARHDSAAFHRFVDVCGAKGRGETTLTFRVGDEDRRMHVRCAALEPDRLLWLLRDVTDADAAKDLLAESAEREHALSEQLRELDQLRRAFLLTVSHDLRSPLAAIAGLASLLTDHPELPEAERERIVVRIRDSSERIAGLFADLLDLERLEGGDLAVQRTEVDVGSVVGQAAGVVDSVDHDVTIETAPTTASVDPMLVGRIVENLLRNAAKHTPAGTHVWVRCRREPDGVLIVVEDDGPGVPAKMRATLFELFERDRRPGGATGLGVGLALVRRFAELHGGHVRIETRPGGGASFHVLLPDEPTRGA